MIRIGLCCLFVKEPVKFRTTTAKRLLTFSRREQLYKISDLCLHNANMLYKALVFCAENSIGCFRVQSGIMPLKTHPVVGYTLNCLPDEKGVRETFRLCRDFAKSHNIRTTFHPDQFVVLSSPHRQVVHNSRLELQYQGEIAGLIGADVINIHCGGVYGDKSKTLRRLAEQIKKLPPTVREKITLENDDKSYTPQDILPLCKELGVPFVYDLHHHRCLEDDIRVKEVTDEAMSTWNREPLFHISSPRNGWNHNNPCYHSDYIDYQDFPGYWKGLDITVEIEAKAKELAAARLHGQLVDEGIKINYGNKLPNLDEPEPKKITTENTEDTEKTEKKLVK